MAQNSPLWTDVYRRLLQSRHVVNATNVSVTVRHLLGKTWWVGHKREGSRLVRNLCNTIWCGTSKYQKYPKVRSVCVCVSQPPTGLSKIIESSWCTGRKTPNYKGQGCPICRSWFFIRPPYMPSIKHGGSQAHFDPFYPIAKVSEPWPAIWIEDDQNQ